MFFLTVVLLRHTLTDSQAPVLQEHTFVLHSEGSSAVEVAACIERETLMVPEVAAVDLQSRFLPTVQKAHQVCRHLATVAEACGVKLQSLGADGCAPAVQLTAKGHSPNKTNRGSGATITVSAHIAEVEGADCGGRDFLCLTLKAAKGGFTAERRTEKTKGKFQVNGEW